MPALLLSKYPEWVLRRQELARGAVLARRLPCLVLKLTRGTQLALNLVCVRAVLSGWAALAPHMLDVLVPDLRLGDVVAGRAGLAACLRDLILPPSFDVPARPALFALVLTRHVLEQTRSAVFAAGLARLVLKLARSTQFTCRLRRCILVLARNARLAH
jgi:hypothetical protein